MPNSWLVEGLHPYYRKSLKIEEVLFEGTSNFQHIQVYRTAFFGVTLVLDGIIQLTERDNMGYHEMLTHVPMMAVENPKKVLVIGGGDGGSLRQVLRYPSVEEAVLCEIDPMVVEVCRKYFTAFGDPLSDPRARFVPRDAFEYLSENKNEFDVIISDTTDPIGMAERLFGDEFYRLMVGALRPNGAIATQSENPYFDKELIKSIYQMAKSQFEHPAYYYAHVPTYPGGGIGFMYGSNVPWTNGLERAYPPGVNEYINKDIHAGAFGLPEFFRAELYG